MTKREGTKRTASQRVKALCLSALLFVMALPAGAQWERTNGPGAVKIRALLARNGLIFAGTDGNGVFVTADNGETWQPCNTGLTMFSIWGLAQNEQFVFAGIPNSGVSRTADLGVSWQPINNGLTTSFAAHIASIGSSVLTSSNAELFRSENSGGIWSQVAGLFETYELRDIEGVFYLGRYKGVERSIDLGKTWQFAGGFPRAVSAIAKCGRTFYASALQISGRGDLYRSSDGANWTAVRQIQATTLDCSNDVVIIGTLNDGAFLSNNAGTTLIPYSARLGDMRVTAAVVAEGMAYVGTESGQVYRRAVATPEAIAVSAASYEAIVPPDSIIAIFGQGFTNLTASAGTVPLPIQLGDITVNLLGVNGATRPLGLFFVSPGQINLALPADVTESGLTLEINTPLRRIIADVTVKLAAPAIFSANADGSGPPAAYVVRAMPDNSQSLEPVALFDSVQGKYVETPIVYGPLTDRLFLVLYGAGFTRVQDPYLKPLNAQFSIEGATQPQFTIEPSFRGSSSYVGVSQMNIRLPRPSVATTYNVAILNDDRFSNVVRVRLSP